ncbi:uncharacterized protein LOC141850468 [Brevipalpus obovatus]|uniref:uncharacterized protein LOC141850468 n=1 Tax=Brevipalpus obovatus TaxID=246614 RepID=UPI003D9F6DA2
MEIMAGYPTIIGKIFNYLNTNDVYQCQLAIPELLTEASRWRERCPAVDSFFSATFLTKIEDLCIGNDYGRSHYMNMRELVLANRKMNDVRCNRESAFYIDPLVWWHLKTGDQYQHLPKPAFDGAIKSFFEKSRRNTFAFVTYNPILRDNIDSLDVDFAICGIGQNPTVFTTDLAQKIYDFTPSSVAKFSEDRKPFSLRSSVQSDFAALKIDRWATNAKIIITDWYVDTLSADDDSEEFPIKSMVHFNSVPGWNDLIEDFLKDRKIVTSGVLVNRNSEICFKHPNSGDLQSSISMSVAFAGKDVKAAVLAIENLLNCEDIVEKLINFKQNLDFPVDNGRVIGFLFNGCEPSEQIVWNQILIFLRQIFPSLNFLEILCSGTCTPSVVIMRGLRVHLVHV